MTSRCPPPLRGDASGGSSVLSAAVVVALVVFFVLRDGGERRPRRAVDPSSTSSTQTAPVPTQTAPDPVPSDPAAEPTVAASVDPEPPARRAPPRRSARTSPRPTWCELGIDGLEQIDGDGTGPGEIDGPAVRFTVDVSNGTADGRAIAGHRRECLLRHRQRARESSSAAPAPHRSTASVPAGGTASGTYVFLIPEGQDTVTIEVFTSAGSPCGGLHRGCSRSLIVVSPLGAPESPEGRPHMSVLRGYAPFAPPPELAPKEP